MFAYYMTTILPMLSRCLGLLIGPLYFSRIMHPHIEKHTQKYIFLFEVFLFCLGQHQADLNIIENVWLLLKNKLNHDPQGPPATKEELQAWVLSEWGQIPRDFIGKLYESLPWRILAVKRKHGYPTKYWNNFKFFITGTKILAWFIRLLFKVSDLMVYWCLMWKGVQRNHRQFSYNKTWWPDRHFESH